MDLSVLADMATSNTKANPPSASSPDSRESLPDSMAALSGQQRRAAGIFLLPGRSVRQAENKIAPAKHDPPQRGPAARGPRKAREGSQLFKGTRASKPAARIFAEAKATASMLPRRTASPAVVKIEPWATGEIIGGYGVEGMINQGGMGVVVRATDTRHGREVALKVMKPNLPQGDLQTIRFHNEARIMREVPCPHIVTLYDVGQTEDAQPLIYMAMELLQGHDLKAHLQEHGALEVGLAMDVALQIARGMALVHEHGITHRDLKPSNIFLVPRVGDSPYLAKILDFGCAKDMERVDQELTDPGTAIGTPAYMAPEQLTNLDPDERMEIYSVGVVLYQMLSGRRPHSGVTYGDLVMKVVTVMPTPINELPSQNQPVPGEIEEVVMRCLEKNPARRYQTMKDLVNALEDALAQLPERCTTLVDIPRFEGSSSEHAVTTGEGPGQGEPPQVAGEGNLEPSFGPGANSMELIVELAPQPPPEPAKPEPAEPPPLPAPVVDNSGVQELLNDIPEALPRPPIPGSRPSVDGGPSPDPEPSRVGQQRPPGPAVPGLRCVRFTGSHTTPFSGSTRSVECRNQVPFKFPDHQEKRGMRSVERATILVVDDDPFVRELLVKLLAREGHKVLEAEDGSKALDHLDRENVDLALLDVMMPVMDGFETCRRIREDRKDLVLPVVFVTALEDRNSRVLGKAAGADDFLTKPIDPIELFARVRTLLRVKAYHDLRARQRQLLEEELDRTREQLLRADRMATFGTLSAGVGHELGNIATIISTARQIVEWRMEQHLEPAVLPAVMDSLLAAERHIETHSRHLMAYGRPGPDHCEELDLGQIVTQTMEMLLVSGKTKYVEVEVVLPDEMAMVTVNRTRVEQVLVNLVCNAADALAEVKDRDKQIRIVVNQPNEGGRIICCVEDNGCGIPEEELGSIFEPYHTTKEPGKGTGLGLAVTRSIIMTYGGDVRVTSDPDQGTCFTFDLPGR